MIDRRLSNVSTEAPCNSVCGVPYYVRNGMFPAFNMKRPAPPVVSPSFNLHVPRPKYRKKTCQQQGIILTVKRLVKRVHLYQMNKELVPQVNPLNRSSGQEKKTASSKAFWSYAGPDRFFCKCSPNEIADYQIVQHAWSIQFKVDCADWPEEKPHIHVGF